MSIRGTWRPDPRPEWVAALNRGQVPPVTEIAMRPLVREDLVDEAQAALAFDDPSGQDRFGTDSPDAEPLDILLRALENEAELTLVGRWLTRLFLIRLLQVRLQIDAYVRADPGVLEEELDAPLFVTGAARSGTTILFGLLNCDPSLRAPEGWELLRPVPPPRPDCYPDLGRVTLAERELRQMATVVSGLDAIHHYHGRMPKECVSTMSLAFLSDEFTARYRVPSYAAYLDGLTSLRPAYEVHRVVLQILQRRFPRRRWLLKSPVHLRSPRTLMDVYPDARVVVTHRDPLTVLPSTTSLIANLRWAHSDHVDFAEIGRAQRDLLQRELDGLVTACQDGTLDPTRTRHVRYEDFMTDPMGAIRGMYAPFGFDLDPVVEERMDRYLAERPKDALGTHRYSFADLHLNLDEERSRFEPYQRWFAVPMEG
jgi:Sulfotransferase family